MWNVWEILSDVYWNIHTERTFVCQNKCGWVWNGEHCFLYVITFTGWKVVSFCHMQIWLRPFVDKEIKPVLSVFNSSFTSTLVGPIRFPSVILLIKNVQLFKFSYPFPNIVLINILFKKNLKLFVKDRLTLCAYMGSIRKFGLLNYRFTL